MGHECRGLSQSLRRGRGLGHVIPPGSEVFRIPGSGVLCLLALSLGGAHLPAQVWVSPAGLLEMESLRCCRRAANQNLPLSKPSAQQSGRRPGSCDSQGLGPEPGPPEVLICIMLHLARGNFHLGSFSHPHALLYVAGGGASTFY